MAALIKIAFRARVAAQFFTISRASRERSGTFNENRHCEDPSGAMHYRELRFMAITKEKKREDRWTERESVGRSRQSVYLYQNGIAGCRLRSNGGNCTPFRNYSLGELTLTLYFRCLRSTKGQR